MAKTFVAAKADLNLAFANDWTPFDASGVQNAAEYLVEVELSGGNEIHFRSASGAVELVVKTEGGSSNIEIVQQALIALSGNAFEYKLLRDVPFKVSLIGYE